METVGERWHRESERHLVRDGVAIGLALMIGWGAFTTIGCAVCYGTDRTDHVERVEVLEATDRTYDPPTEEEGQLTEEQETEDPPAEELEYEAVDWEGDWYAEEYAPTYGQQEYCPSDGLTPEGGINYHDGRLETYYSSAVLYHQDTESWTLDDEGFYRDQDGRYVVAASDMEQGTVFEGSKGECIVLDTGCDAGVTDYYVAWK